MKWAVLLIAGGKVTQPVTAFTPKEAVELFFLYKRLFPLDIVHLRGYK